MLTSSICEGKERENKNGNLFCVHIIYTKKLMVICSYMNTQVQCLLKLCRDIAWSLILLWKKAKRFTVFSGFVFHVNWFFFLEKTTTLATHAFVSIENWFLFPFCGARSIFPSIKTSWLSWSARLYCTAVRMRSFGNKPNFFQEKKQISEHETAAIKQNKKLQSSFPTWPLGEFQPMD